jgi:trehalose-phosphatase
VSGRTAVDVRGKVGLENLVYVGGHGAEILWEDGVVETAGSVEFRRELESLKRELTVVLAEIPGVLLEDKQSCLAVHYRTVATRYVDRISAAVSHAVRSLPGRECVQIAEGKRVLELRHASGADKGRAVRRLLAREEDRREGIPLYPVYVGDDVTDEDAFAVLKHTGLTVFVGPAGRSKAEYRLSDTEEVSTLLRMLAEHYAGVK